MRSRRYWGWLEARKREHWPTLLRGDIAHGNEEMMAGAEQRELSYVFKLRQSKGVAKRIAKLARLGEKAGWREAGQRWEGVEDELELEGWSRKRRVIVLRRPLPKSPAPQTQTAQLALPGLVIEHKGGDWYEHAVLVTNWEQPELLAIAQIYRDRGDAENMFDELKNQWGWTGFSTADLKRSPLMARMVALIFNWWSIFTRMAIGSKHGEAITTRPLFQHGVARRTRHANQTRLSLSSQHGKSKKIAYLLTGISSWLQQLKTSAEQLAAAAHWPALLRRIFQDFGQFPFALPRISALLPTPKLPEIGSPSPSVYGLSRPGGSCFCRNSVTAAASRFHHRLRSHNGEDKQTRFMWSAPSLSPVLPKRQDHQNRPQYGG